MSASLGIIVFAHGSRDERWRLPAEALAQRVAALDPEAKVRCAYLELIEPDLAGAAQALIDAGASEIRVLPFFLGVGKHLREDLPKLLQGLRQRHPQVRFTARPAVGEDAELIELLARKALDP